IADFCPDGRALFRSRQTSLPRRCVLNSLNDCSPGFSCQSRVKGVTQGFCCTERSVCKGDAQFIVDDVTRMPTICTPGLFHSCPLGYHCQLPKPQSTTGFCCKLDETAVTEGCPPTEFALTNERKVVECDPFNSTHSCPTGFTCQFAVLFQRYQCCGKTPSDETELINKGNGCLPNQVALVERDQVVLCSASGKNCPTGYFCHFSTENHQFQCCGIKSDCPGKSMAYLNLDGEAMKCAMEFSSCPEGFSCLRTKHNKLQCCTIDETSPTPVQNVTSSSVPQESQATTKASTMDMKSNISTAAPCSGNMILVNGMCKKRILKTPCFLRNQCPSGMECINFICEEKGEKSGPLRRPACAEGNIRVNGTCMKTVGISGKCSVSDQCQGGSQCHNGTCQCESGTAIYKGICRAKLCGDQRVPALTPQLAAIECIHGTACPTGSSCMYSPAISMYVCCAPLIPNVNHNPAIIRTTTRTPVMPFIVNPRIASLSSKCPDGQEPMLFPSTNQPLVCDRNHRCPTGFVCTERKCCPLERQRRSVEKLCPRGYRTLLDEISQTQRCG
ncbi:hypothetical protein GCK32_013042, partial [Trichostrongylus colubriformis]